MIDQTARAPIVVGVPGEATRHDIDLPVRWAAATATTRGAPLWLVSAYLGRDGRHRRDALGAAAHEAVGTLEATAARVAADHPNLPVAMFARCGTPVGVLGDVGADARLVVVGRRGGRRVRVRHRLDSRRGQGRRRRGDRPDPRQGGGLAGLRIDRHRRDRSRALARRTRERVLRGDRRTCPSVAWTRSATPTSRRCRSAEVQIGGSRRCRIAIPHSHARPPARPRVPPVPTGPAPRGGAASEFSGNVART